jgi:hypothetical protein
LFIAAAKRVGKGNWGVLGCVFWRDGTLGEVRTTREAASLSIEIHGAHFLTAQNGREKRG